MNRANLSTKLVLDLKYQRVCCNDKPAKEIRRPNISEESQFHQPPQVPSCKAHQLPIHNATKLIEIKDQIILCELCRVKIENNARLLPT